MADDPRYDTRAARAAIAKFVTLHDTNLDQKAQIVVEHFRTRAAGEVGGRAKAMVVCSSRPHAVRFGRALRAYVKEHGYDLGVLVAFSGTVDDAGAPFTEASMNGFPDTETAKKFDTDEFRILVVAEKFQTGFDQPLLYAMYVDKTLSGLDRGPDPVPAEPHPSGQGRHLRPRLPQRRRGHPGGVRAVLRRNRRPAIGPQPALRTPGCTR